MTICQPLPGQTLRKFWTYGAGACGEGADPCGRPCGLPGFSLVADAAGQTTISTAGRAASIATLILMTRAERTDGSPCARLPQTRAGYWADAFRSDGQVSGSQIYWLPPNTPARDAVALIQAYAQRDLQKMVTMGEAQSVKVTARYGGGGTILLTARIAIDGRDVDVPFAAAGTGGGWAIGPAA